MAGHVYLAGDVPPRDVVCVLGAPPTPQGALPPLLRARLQTALELLHAQRSPRLLLTGRPDEVDALQRGAMSGGVSSDRLVVDRGSYRTIDSFVRGRELLKLRSMIVVTNPFHLPRALYLAHACGIDAVGVEARGTGGAPLDVRQRLREQFARARARYDVHRMKQRSR